MSTYKPGEVVYVRCKVNGDQKSHALRVGEQALPTVWLLAPVKKSGLHTDWDNVILVDQEAILTKDQLVAAMKGQSQ